MTVSPHIGVLINIHEEHLDHYGTMEKYVAAKHRIFRNQDSDDILVCNMQCLPEPGECPSRLIRVGTNRPDADVNVDNCGENGTFVDYGCRRYRIPETEIRLLGQHNYFDIAVVYAVCGLLGSRRSHVHGGSQILRAAAPPPSVSGAEGRREIL